MEKITENSLENSGTEGSAPLLPTIESIQAIASEVSLAKSRNVPDPLSWSAYLNTLNQYTNPEARFDAMWFYLFAQRVGEAVSRTKAKDIQVRNLNGREFLVLETVTEKNRQTPYRELGIPFDGREKPLVEKAYEWVQRLKPEQEIMPYKRQTAWNHLKRVQVSVKTLNKFTRERQQESFGVYPHYLRHCRASHMAIDYNYDYKRMLKFFGWTTPRMVDYYFTSNWAYLARGFEEGTT